MKDEQFLNELDIRSKELKRKLKLLDADNVTDEQVKEMDKPENEFTDTEKKLLITSLLVSRQHDRTFTSGGE